MEKLENLRKAGRLEDALKEYGALAASASNTADRAAFMLSQVSLLCEMGESASARKLWNDAKGILPQQSEFSALAKFAESDILMTEGRYSQMLDKLDEIERFHSTLLDSAEYGFLRETIRARRGIALALLKRPDEALSLLEGAHRVEPTDGTICFYLSSCYFNQALYAKARDMLIEAFQHGIPTHLQYRAHFALGLTYYHLRSLARALEQFELCLKAPQSIREELDLNAWLAATRKYLGLDPPPD